VLSAGRDAEQAFSSKSPMTNSRLVESFKSKDLGSETPLRATRRFLGALYFSMCVYCFPYSLCYGKIRFCESSLVRKVGFAWSGDLAGREDSTSFCTTFHYESA
jgi:hypothetical protein